MDNFKDRDLRISLNDLFHLFKKKRKTIYKWTIYSALFFSLLTLIRPVMYESEAIFWDKTKKQSGLSSGSLSALLENGLGNATPGSEATAAFKSRRLIGNTIKKLNMQGSIKAKNDFTHGYARSFFENVVGEYSHLTSKKVPVLSELNPELKFTSIGYNGEVPLEYRIRFTSEDEFVIIDSEHKGTLGLPVNMSKVTFVLAKTEKPSKLEGKTFKLTFNSLDRMINIHGRTLKVVADKQDKSFIKITYENRDRHLASQFVNTLMAEYQDYLKKENKKISEAQLNYLFAREDESIKNLETLLNNYAGKLSTGYEMSGFPDSEKEMEFLGTSQQESLKHILNLDLESRRLQQIDQENVAYYDRFYQTGDADVVNEILSRVREFQQLRDVISLAINDTKHSSEEKFVEFQGIALNTSEELYQNFCRQINELQSLIKQHQFVLERMGHPEFEISSLSVSLTDPISQEMISKASEIALSLKDDNNRSSKELERLKEDLELQKRFLYLHVKHIIQLKKLEEELVQKKLTALQNVRFNLINQQISILEKNLADYVNVRMVNLKQERGLLENHLQQLQQQMTLLPKKWATEQLIKQRIQLNRGIMEEVAKLVETKNISHNLESIQSTPLDVAVPALLPKTRHLLLFATFGGLVGGLTSFGLLLVGYLSRGMEASQDNLTAMGQHISGNLTSSCEEGKPLFDADLETLRRVMSFIPIGFGLGNSLLIIKGKGPNFSMPLAALMSKKGFKVLVIDLSFNKAQNPKEPPGLLQYLEGSVEKPTTEKSVEGYDFVRAGGISRFSSELLNNEAFKKLLRESENSYDLVIGVSDALPHSGEAEELLQLFENIAVLVNGETIHELHSYLKTRSTFIFT